MYKYGKNVALEALNNNDDIKKAYLYENFTDQEILSKLKNKNIKIEYLRKNELNKLENGNHQGIVLETEDYKYYSLDDMTDDVIVVLDHLEDPHNFGAIIRTCEAAGINNIIIPKDRSVKVNGTVIKTSVGTTQNVKIAMVSNLVNALKTLKNNGYWVIGTDMQGTNYKEIDYQGKIVIVIGNEGKGIGRLIKENCDFVASIPMRGTVNSLNASVAAALIIYEAVNSR